MKRHVYTQEKCSSVISPIWPPAARNTLFSVLRLSKVYAIIKADNTASIKVAQRIGMQKEDEFLTQYYACERLHLLYSAENGRQCAAKRRNL